MNLKLPLLLFFFCVNQSIAQSINSFVINSEGTVSRNGSIGIAFSIGEPIVGPISNGTYRIQQGFTFGSPSLTTGVSEEHAKTLHVFPNPTTGIVNISKTSSSYSVKVWDTHGKVHEFPNSNDRVDLTDMPAGLYLLKIQIEHSLSTKTVKVIKY